MPLIGNFSKKKNYFLIELGIAKEHGISYNKIFDNIMLLYTHIILN